MDTVLDKLEEEDFYYQKQEPIQSKERVCTWQWKNVFFLPIQIIQETIKTGLKKPSKTIFIWSDF